VYIQSMSIRAGALTASAAVAAAVAIALLLLAARGAEPSPAATPATDSAGCSEQSSASFPGAFADRRNLVVGPLAMIGGRTFTDEATARRFGGNKYPLLLRAGHRATVAIAARDRAHAGLSYGSAPDGPAGLDEAASSIAFVSCSPARALSRAGGPVTFWSGGVLVRSPACVALDVTVDREPRRRVRLELGARCTSPPPLRDCATRAEGGAPPDTETHPGDVVVGPFTFLRLDRVASRRGLEHYRSRRGYQIKAGVAVAAGARATLAIGRRARGWAALVYAPRRPGEPERRDAAVRFQACAADEPAFSYDGPVGPVTGFSGGFILQRRGCVPLEARVPGRPTVRIVVPFGVRRCQAAP
jgi:hypothetical protein